LKIKFTKDDIRLGVYFKREEKNKSARALLFFSSRLPPTPITVILIIVENIDFQQWKDLGKLKRVLFIGIYYTAGKVPDKHFNLLKFLSL